VINNCCTLVCILYLATSFLFTADIGRPSATRCTQSFVRDCVQRETDQARSRAIHIHGRPWIVCMTARIHLMPKTTEQNRIVRTGKFEVEVTNNKKTALEVLYYWSNEANCCQIRSIARPFCDSRATCLPSSRSTILVQTLWQYFDRDSPNASWYEKLRFSTEISTYLGNIGPVTVKRE